MRTKRTIPTLKYLSDTDRYKALDLFTVEHHISQKYSSGLEIIKVLGHMEIDKLLLIIWGEKGLSL